MSIHESKMMERILNSVSSEHQNTKTRGRHYSGAVTGPHESCEKWPQ